MRGTKGSWRLFALHLGVASLGFATALVVVSALIVFGPAVLDLDPAAPSQLQVERAARRMLELHATFWPVALSCLGAVVLTSFLLYRRMTSPFVRLRAAFRQVAEGALPGPISIRGHDYMRDEVDLVNEMTRSLRSRLSLIQQEAEALFDRVDELVGQVAETPDGGALLDALSQIDVRRKRLQVEMDSLGPLSATEPEK